MSNFNFLGNFLGKKADFKKDGHDMSNTEAFSQSFGRWLPIKCIDVVPGEHYEVKVDGYIQTAPMREDNFMQISNNLKAVFVPFSSVYRNYLSSTQNNRDTRSDLLFPKNLYKLRTLASPLLDVMYFYYVNFYIYRDFKALVESYHSDNTTWYIVTDRHELATAPIYLQNYLTSPPVGLEAIQIELYTSSDGWSFDVNTYPFLYTWLSNPGIMDSNDAFGFSLMDFEYFIANNQTLGRNYILWDMLSSLDMCGYPNFLPILATRFEKDFRSGGNSTFSDYSARCFDFASDSYDFCIKGFDVEGDHWGDYFDDTTIDLTPLLALRLYEYSHLTSNYIKPFTTALTADFLASAAEDLDWLDSDLYIPWPSKYYGSQADIQHVVKIDNEVLFTFLGFGDSIYDLNLQEFVSYLFSHPNPLLSPDLFTTMVDSVVQGSIPSTSSSDLERNLVQTLADTSALYKLKQDLKRAGVRRDKQMEVIFGVKSHHNPLMPECYELGSKTNDIKITSLINQAETAEAPLGARASRGNGSNGLTFELSTAEDFGWIFILSSFTCPSFYENFMFDRNRLNGFEAMFNPRFNHLGLEAVQSYDCSIVGQESVSGRTGVALENIGFSARYFYLKQAVNKVHGLFTNFGMQFPQVNPDGSTRTVPSALQRGNALFGGFLSTVLSQQVNRFSNYSDLYFDPTQLNNIFTQMVDSGAYSDPVYDQFRCIFHYQIHKVSPMPKLGLLKLDV